jgi:hypothetical protein
VTPHRIPLRVVAGAPLLIAVLVLAGGPRADAVVAAAKASRATSTVACSPSALSATLVLSPVGSASTAVAGAVVFANGSGRACTLRGVPRVSVVSPSGQALGVYQESSVPHTVRPVTLARSGSTAPRPDAAVSITWSAWSCARGTFTLDIHFAGWRGSMTVPWTPIAGAPAPAACSGSQETIFVGPVARTTPPV